MRILFYIEPHPIRENSLEFYWVANELIKMISLGEGVHNFQDFEFKLFCTSQIHKQLKKKCKFVINKSLIIELDKDINNNISKKYSGPWNKERVSIWKSLMNGKGSVVDFYENIIRGIYEDYQFDLIMTWGLNGAVKNFSQKLNICYILMELGPVRKPFFDSVCIDFKSLSSDSYINLFKGDIEKFPIHHSLSNIRKSLHINKQNSRNIRFYYLDWLLKRNTGNNILIPLQLKDDASIIIWSKYDSMLQFLQEVLPQLVNAGYTCFVKPHPGRKSRSINYEDHLICKKYVNKLNNVFWLDFFDNSKLLISFYSRFDYFILVNSSVGFEAMLMGKVVVSLGESIYNSLLRFPKIDELIKGDIPIVEYNRNAKKMVNILLFYYIHNKHKSFTLEYFLKMVEFNCKLRDCSTKDVSTMIPIILSEKLLYNKLEV